MTDLAEILNAINRGDSAAAEKLLPLVYEELRALAAAKLAHERSGQTLQATALVHEAYLRLSKGETAQRWDSTGHFFAAAAEAMRRILVENARRKRSLKAGGNWHRVGLPEAEIKSPDAGVDVLALSEALDRLSAVDARKAELVKLRYFAGLTIREAALALSVSPSTADNDWAYARSWLKVELNRGTTDSD